MPAGFVVDTSIVETRASTRTYDAPPAKAAKKYKVPVFEPVRVR